MPITVREAIQKIQKEIKDSLPDKDRDIIEIMEYVIGLNEVGIIKSFDYKLTPKQLKKLNEAISRLKKNEPIEYITGMSHFYEYKFRVSPKTLIPRVETEHIVDLALERIYKKVFREKPVVPTVVDVGTGTGCIIISLAKSIREPVQYHATDISPEALKIAHKNVKAYELEDQITLAKGNLLSPIPPKVKFDIIVANLPYIPEHDLQILPKSVKDYEPHKALDGGENGTSLIKELLVQAEKRLKPEGSIILELQPKILEKVGKFAERFYPKAKVSVAKDTFDVDRFVVIDS